MFHFSFQAHMVYSEHDASFYALDKQVNLWWWTSYYIWILSSL